MKNANVLHFGDELIWQSIEWNDICNYGIYYQGLIMSNIMI